MRNSRRFALALLPFLALCACGTGTGSPAAGTRVVPRDGAVVIDVADVVNGGGSFMTYASSSGKDVGFFLYRDSRGEVRAAFDACRSCYRWKQGYRLGERYVECRKCGERYEIDGLAEGRGTCVPILLAHSRKDDVLAIRVEDLEAGARYF